MRDIITPKVAVDLVIMHDRGIVIIERKNKPFGLALPGGFVDVGETLEQAAMREAKEETGLDVDGLRQVHAYSDPARDERFHVVSICFLCKGEGRLHAGDDAADAKVYPLGEIPRLVADHNQMIEAAFRR